MIRQLYWEMQFIFFVFIQLFRESKAKKGHWLLAIHDMADTLQFLTHKKGYWDKWYQRQVQKWLKKRAKEHQNFTSLNRKFMID